ncbi:AMP-binding protein [Phenylobacterium sp. J426]|uniref:acyl-CoA synthetase n=1 Tax=Phenylobacterium sp. J426 TaxID=2898439 RepID=UPI002150789F|nr:acyl-CoA synthetase [Phenylobacterium sp. J426]MCR5874690.1 AMP-binding protein [Phenylobacterium sp. J426]
MGDLISGSRRLSLATVSERAARAAAGLASLGIGPGDLVALYLRNDFPFFEASFAAGLVGAYPTPVNWHYTPDEARYLFENSGARAIVIHADLIAGIREALPPGVPVLVVATPPEIAAAYGMDAAATPPGMTDWSAWLEGFAPLAADDAAAPGSVIYTSGTTGHPKGVRRAPPTAEQAMVTGAIIGRAFGFMGFGEPQDIVTVVTGPMYHSAPNAYGLAAARLGATVILQPRFEPEDLLQLIERERVTHLHMVPIMFHRLLKLPDEVKARYDLSSLKFVVHAAAPCPPPIKRAMIEWWGPVINEYYGSTEVSAVTFCTSEEWLAHPGTVGRAWPEADVRVIGADGESLPTGEVGEVVARIRGMADFTYHGDDAKRRASEKAGLIAPGDIGSFDKDGFLYLCDRAKDMIISGGVNIYPAEIEAELLKMPGVADCAVFGIPDEEFGEGVYAVVQPQPGFNLDEAGVKAYLRARVAGYKVPKQVDFASDLPREDSGKIFKRKLREPFWAGLERRI